MGIFRPRARYLVPKDPRACGPGPDESPIRKVFLASGAQYLALLPLLPGLRPWIGETWIGTTVDRRRLGFTIVRPGLLVPFASLQKELAPQGEIPLPR